MKITKAPLDELTEDPANARLHPQENLGAIKASLLQFGQRLPLVVRNGIVIIGNGRLRVMRSLGWETCSVVDASDLSEQQARMLALADNRTAELAFWDSAALAEVLKGFAETALADLTAIGFDESLLQNIVSVIESGDLVEDPSTEWEGMPAFEHEDLRPVRQILVSFADLEDCKIFADRLGLDITDKTKSVWFPPQERAVFHDRRVFVEP